MTHKFLISCLTVIAIVSLGTALSCSSGPGNQTSSNGASPTPAAPAPSPKTGFEADLEYVRKGQYTYVWVFSRKDGKPLDKNDAAFLRTTAPQVVDWVTTDEGKKVIAGTNFDLTKGPLEPLKKRFNVEDFTAQ